MNFLNNIWKNTTLVLIIAITVLAVLFLQQCNSTRNQKQKLQQTEQIATQNEKAMKDSSIELLMTRQQLAESDSNLAEAVAKADSIIRTQVSRKDHVVEVITAAPVVTQKDVTVNNAVTKDPVDTSKQSLTFRVDDIVKSFNGETSFYLTRTDSTISIVPGTTKISDFKLNFDFLVVKYDDPVAKVSHYKIIPTYKDAQGAMHTMDENVMHFTFRGVETLDRPFQYNDPSPLAKKKLRLVGMWGLGVNPIGFGPVMQNGALKFGYTPSVSFGYFLTLQKK